MKIAKKSKKYDINYMLNAIKNIVDGKYIGEIHITFSYSDGSITMLVLNYMENEKMCCTAYVTGYYENGMFKRIPCSEIIPEIETIVSEGGIKAVHCDEELVKN